MTGNQGTKYVVQTFCRFTGGIIRESGELFFRPPLRGGTIREGTNRANTVARLLPNLTNVSKKFDIVSRYCIELWRKDRQSNEMERNECYLAIEFCVGEARQLPEGATAQADASPASIRIT